MRAFDKTPAALFALLALVPATSGTARGLLIPGFKLSDIIVLVILVTILFRFSLAGRFVDPIGWVLLAYGTLHLTFTAINFLRRPDLADSTFLDIGKEMVSGLQYAVIFLVAVLLSRNSASPAVWLRWTLGIASFIAVIAFLQELGAVGIREVLATVTGNPRILEWEVWQDARATGPFFSWHALGIYLSIHATIAIALLFRAALTLRDRLLIGGALLLLCLGLTAALTLTPAALTAIAVVALVPWRRFSRRNLGMILGGLVILSAVALALFWPQIMGRFHDQGETVTPGLPRTLAYRVLFWTRDYLPIIGRNLWTGYGPLGPDDDIYPHTESMYITVLMAGGIVLLIVFVAFMASSVIGMVRAQRAFPPTSIQSALASAMLVVAVFLIGAQLIHPYFDDAGGAPLFVIGLGVVIGQHLRTRPQIKEQNDSASPPTANVATSARIRASDA